MDSKVAKSILEQTARNKTITGCAHCCNDDQRGQWENGKFDTCRAETPESFIVQKLGFLLRHEVQYAGQFLWESA